MERELSDFDIENELYDAYLVFLKEALKEMSSAVLFCRKLRKANRKTKVRFGSLQDFKTVKEDILIYNSAKYIVEGLRKQLESLKAYKKIVKLMNKDDVIRSHLGDSIIIFGGIYRWDHWSYVSLVLKELFFRKVITNNFDLTLFNKLFSDLEHFFNNKKIPFLVVSPLHDFQMDKNKSSLCLSNFLSIRKITRNERIRLGDKLIVSESESEAFDTIKYVLEYKFNIDKNLGSSRSIGGDLPENISSIFSSVITALRLFKYGNIGIYDRYTICSLDVPITPVGLRLYAISLGSSVGMSYILTRKEITEFSKFWSSYSALLINKILDYKRYPNDKYVNIKNSFNRFNYGYSRKDGNDKFVDYVIGLEAIFSKKGDPPRGFTDRFSNRASFFLEKEPQKRRLIYCEMRNLYALRSEIVHGGYTEAIDILKIRDYLVKSFVKYFDLMKSNIFSHDSLIYKLDRSPNQLKRKNCMDV